MEKKEITDEQKLYALLMYKKDRTEEEERIISTLEKKVELGSKSLKDAAEECHKQKWLTSVHVVEESGCTTKSYHKIELSDSGKGQIAKFWRQSKYNHRNIWKSRLKTWTPIAGAIFAILIGIDKLWSLVWRTIAFLWRIGNL